MSKTSFGLALFVIFLVLDILAIAAMMVSIGKSGDEMRKMIIEKAAANTFYITIGLFIFDNLMNIIHSFSHISMTEVNPFSRLVVLSFIFLFQLMFLKRRNGLTRHGK